jgi:hypothetical protein
VGRHTNDCLLQKDLARAKEKKERRINLIGHRFIDKEALTK